MSKDEKKSTEDGIVIEDLDLGEGAENVDTPSSGDEESLESGGEEPSPAPEEATVKNENSDSEPVAAADETEPNEPQKTPEHSEEEVPAEGASTVDDAAETSGDPEADSGDIADEVTIIPEKQRDSPAIIPVEDSTSDFAGRDSKGEWENLLGELEEELLQTEDAERHAVLHYSIGEIIEVRFNDPEKAITHYIKALDDDPSHQPAIKAAIRLYRDLGNFSRVIELMGAQEKSTLTGKEKVDLLIEKAEIYLSRLNQTLLAVEHLEKALKIDPQNSAAFKLIEKIYATGDDTGALIAFYNRYVEDPHFGVFHLQLLQNLAQIQEEKEHTQEAAIKTYQRIIDLEPTNLLAITALQRLLSKHQRWEDLFAVYEREEKATQDSQRKGLLKYLQARIAIEQHQDPDGAVELLNEGLEADPGNALLLNELEIIYESERNWTKLVDIHRWQLETVKEPEKRAEIAFKMGTLLLERIGDDNGAAKWFETVLNARPDDMPALQALEKIYSAGGEHSKLINILSDQADCLEDEKLKASRYFLIAEIAHHHLEDHELAIVSYKKMLNFRPGYLPAIKALSELYAFLGRVDEWIEMNEMQIEAASDLNPEQIIYLLEKNASLQEHKGEFDKAIDCYKRILKRSSKHIQSVRSLGRLYARAEVWEKLVEINELETSLIDDPDRVSSLLCKNGEICRDKLSDNERAEKFFSIVLEKAPSYFPALRALEDLYKAGKRFEDLLSMYRRELEAVGEGEEAAETRLKIARFHEDDLKKTEEAECEYRAILEKNIDFSPAVFGLIRLYERQGDHKALVELYERISKEARDPSNRLQATNKAAELYETRLKEPALAEKLYQDVLARAPENLPALIGLMRIYAQINDRPGQLKLIEAQLQNEDDQYRRLQLLVSAADIYNEIGGKDEDTISVYREILKIDPDDGIAFLQLERLHRKAGNFNDLADLYEEKLSRIEDEKEKLGLLWVAIDILENHLGDFDRLRGHFASVLQIDPVNSRALSFFEDIFTRERRWEELLGVYERMRNLTEDKKQLLHIYTAAGQIYELELRRPDEAIRYYENARALDPTNLSAVSGARRTYGKLEMWNDLAELLESCLDHSSSSSSYISTAYQLGHIRETKFNLRIPALKMYLKALDLDPGHEQAFKRAEALLKEEKDHRKLVELHEKRLPVTKDDILREESHRRIAELCEENLTDLARAIEHRSKLLELHPTNNEEKRRLADLYVKTSKWEDAIRLYGEIIPSLRDDEELRNLRFEIGRIYEEELEDLKKAAKTFESARELMPNDLQILERLGRLYKSLNQAEKSRDNLLTLLANPLPKEKEIRYHLLLGELYLEDLDDEAEAVSHFDKVLTLDPNNLRQIETMAELFERHDKWESLIQMYERNIAALVDADIERKNALQLGLARIYIDKTNDVENALKVLGEAYELDKTNIEIQKLQARAMGMNALYYLDAINKHLQLIGQNPFRVENHKELYRIFKERGQKDNSYCTLMVLDFLKALSEEESEAYKEMKKYASGGGIAGTIPEKDQELLLTHPGERGLLKNIFGYLEPAFYKLRPPELGRLNLPSCKVAGVNSSIYHLMENAAHHLGVDLFTLYISQKDPDIVAVENTKPPTIVLGGNLAFAGEGIKRFLAGSIMSMVKKGHGPFIHGSHENLQFWVEAACQLYIPDITVHHGSLGDITSFTANLNRALPKPVRKELEEAARSYQKLESPPDFVAFQMAMRHTDNRMGLLLSGDLEAIAECLVFLDTGESYRPSNSTAEVIERFRGNEQMKEIIKFAVSKEFSELRKIIRISVD